MGLKISVLTIGDELLNGELPDTNTTAIARRLETHGYRVRDSRTVADVEEEIAEALTELATKRDVLIVTGGLGPTGDDLTARAAARAFNRHLALNDEALRQIREHFLRSGREMHPRNEKQALLPQKAMLIPNPLGSAPGFVLHQGVKVFYFLPGVPVEMTAMLEQTVLPQLKVRSGEEPLRQERIFKIFGLAEPKVEELVQAVPLPPGVAMAFGVDGPMVHLKLRAGGGDASTLLDQAEGTARWALGDFLVAVDDETLPGNVARLLTAAGLNLALAESCTGGLIATLLTDIPGASAFLERGVVTYANSAKTSWLKVPPVLLERDGAVSESCALAMARGVRLAAQTDLGLAVTGIAGPSGGTPEKPVGTVFLALCAADQEAVKRYHFGGSREEVRRHTACMALEWLRRYLVARPAANRAQDAAGGPARG